ncbi:MAG: AgmX/PglI C-terminal domain-containing protein [Bdellovibrio sp.]|nr:AgmX/PglI C-terminal domain-containing protein [Bdellovibrio sp.]
MKLKAWLVPALIAVGVLLIFFSTFLTKSSSRKSVSDSDLAFLNEKTGSVTVQNYEMPEPIQLKTNFSLHPKDVIKTDANSDALIQFNNEGQLRLAENTEILLDLLDSQAPVVIVKSGEVFVEKFGAKPSFWIRKDGQSLSAVDFALADKKNAPKLKDPIPNKLANETLSQNDIEVNMAARKNDFFKCYGQTLQRNLAARGSVLVAFTIEKNGQTSKIEISKSDIQDNTFKSCLMEVVARTQFKSFTGSPISTVFPLKFE